MRATVLRSLKIDFFLLSSVTDPLDINPSVDFLFDCGLVGPEDVSAEQDLPRTMRKVRAGAAKSTEGGGLKSLGWGWLSSPSWQPQFDFS